ncbi:putative holin [Acinetobacter phage Aristophanes]|uniref:Putative holin n=1 Tax=Acinetobacter phage Aristophanes TaxID=2759203 RepID=A0A7G9VYQ1_BPACA|nr:putative holin [Acinetobacter phage Aristophanes]
MNFIDQVYLVLVYTWSELSKNAHVLMGAILAVTISYLKTHKEKREQNWGENLLCGIFAGIALTGVSIIQKLIVLAFPYLAGIIIPTELVVGMVAGIIAWYGTDGTIKLISKFKRGKDNGSKSTEDSK